MSSGKRILVRQTRGSARRTQRVKATLQALGLGRVGKQREFTANDAVLGMIARVNHLVEMREIEA